MQDTGKGFTLVSLNKAAQLHSLKRIKNKFGTLVLDSTHEMSTYVFYFHHVHHRHNIWYTVCTHLDKHGHKISTVLFCQEGLFLPLHKNDCHPNSLLISPFYSVVVHRPRSRTILRADHTLWILGNHHCISFMHAPSPSRSVE